MTPAQIARRVREESRAALVGQINLTEAEIDRSIGRVTRRLERQLRTLVASQVQAAIDAAMREIAQEAARHIAAGIGAASVLGARAAQAQHERLTRPGGPMHDPAAADIPSRIGVQAQQAQAQARIQGEYTRDRIPLSTRLYRRTNETAESATRIIRSSIEAREGVFRAAENFIAENRHTIRVELPQYTQELIDAARRSLDTDDRSVLLDAIDRHARYMDSLGNATGRPDGQTSLRSAVRQFVSELQRARPDNIDALIQRHIEDRAQYQARRIARSEMAEANRQAYRASVNEQPYVVGLRWTLSPNHPRADVCDLLANQDLHGLGPGGYPKGSYPETPHANCLCGPESIQDPHYFRRRIAERDGLEPPPRPWERDTHATAEEWIVRQPEAVQRTILGPTRLSILRDPNDDRRVLTPGGVPIPVGQITGANTSRRPTATVPLQRTF